MKVSAAREKGKKGRYPYHPFEDSKQEVTVEFPIEKEFTVEFHGQKKVTVEFLRENEVIVKSHGEKKS